MGQNIEEQPQVHKKEEKQMQLLDVHALYAQWILDLNCFIIIAAYVIMS